MRTKIEYGDKRNYRKIAIYVDGKYVCTTTWSRTCAEAAKRYSQKPRSIQGVIRARFAK